MWSVLCDFWRERYLEHSNFHVGKFEVVVFLKYVLFKNILNYFFNIKILKNTNK